MSIPIASQGNIKVIMAVPLPLVLLRCSPQQAPEIFSKLLQIFQILLKQCLKGEHITTPTVFLSLLPQSVFCREAKHYCLDFSLKNQIPLHFF